MPKMFPRLTRRLRALFRGRDVDRDLDEEIRLHVELETEALMAREGLTREEARRRALVAFGGVERYREEHRDARGLRWLRELGQDIRFAVRTLRRTPGFTLSALLILALGIGAATAVFALANAVLFAPLPFPHEQRLVQIYEQNSPTNRFGLSVADVRGIERWQHAFAAVGVLRGRQVPLATAGRPAVEMPVGYVTSGFFQTLGVRAEAGRLLSTADDAVGAPSVAVVTHAFAARELGGDRAAIGRTVTIDGAAHVVVGVVPTIGTLRADVWPNLELRAPTRRGPFGLFVVGRLADGATLQMAQQDLHQVSAQLFPEWATSFQDRSATLTPVSLRRALLGDAPRAAGLLVGAVALVLLVAVTNVASLMLVRVSARWHEVSLRAALGAGRGRLIRLLVTESAVLATTAAVLGFGLGALAVRGYRALGPALASAGAVHLDWRAAVVGALLALIAGAAIGTYPAVVVLRHDLAPRLRAGARALGGAPRSHAVRGGFVVAQFALALPVLAGAGLLINSFMRLERVAPGVDPAHLLAVPVALPTARYGTDSATQAYWQTAMARVRAVTGVADATLNDAMLPDARPNLDENNFDLADRPVPPGTAQPTAPWVAVTPGYFHALGVPLLEGRVFQPGDTAADAPPATPLVVSRAWARHYFPDGSALGRRLVAGGCVTCAPSIVVGVVGNVKYAGLNGTDEAIYEPAALARASRANLFVRTTRPAAQVLTGVVEALRSVDPGVPLDDAAPLSERVDGSVSAPRGAASLLGSFALAALTLAAVGVFGLLSYSVSERRREIGVRMALGARPASVVKAIVWEGMRHAAIGAGLGLGIALLATRSLAGRLFGVHPTDPATLAGTSAVLLVAALAACWIPARRAAAIDAAEALRAE